MNRKLMQEFDLDASIDEEVEAEIRSLILRHRLIGTEPGELVLPLIMGTKTRIMERLLQKYKESRNLSQS